MMLTVKYISDILLNMMSVLKKNIPMKKHKKGEYIW